MLRSLFTTNESLVVVLGSNKRKIIFEKSACLDLPKKPLVYTIVRKASTIILLELYNSISPLASLLIFALYLIG